MTVRSILSAHKAVLLGGVLLTTMLPAPFAMAQDANLPVKAEPAANDSIWYSHGVFDAGGNIFIEKPPSGFGRIPTDPFWLTPKTTDSNAKMDEYGKVPRGLFLDVFGLNAGTKDGRFAVDSGPTMSAMTISTMTSVFTSRAGNTSTLAGIRHRIC
jgi:hypothetical protein